MFVYILYILLSYAFACTYIKNTFHVNFPYRKYVISRKLKFTGFFLLIYSLLFYLPTQIKDDKIETTGCVICAHVN